MWYIILLFIILIVYYILDLLQNSRLLRKIVADCKQFFAKLTVAKAMARFSQNVFVSLQYFLATSIVLKHALVI